MLAWVSDLGQVKFRLKSSSRGHFRLIYHKLYTEMHWNDQLMSKRTNSWPGMWRKMDVADAVGAASACWVCGDRNVSMALWPASKGCIVIRLGLIDDVRPVSWGSRNWSEPTSWQSDIQSTALCPLYLRLKLQDDAATIQHQVYLSSPLQSCTPTDGADEQNNRIGVETNQKKQTVRSKSSRGYFLLTYPGWCIGMICWWAKEWHANER